MLVCAFPLASQDQTRHENATVTARTRLFRLLQNGVLNLWPVVKV